MANALLTPDEFAAATRDDIQALKPKRGGRKPGSKNKPKIAEVGIMPAAERASVAAYMGEQLRTATGSAIAFLETAAAIKVSAMDSESRLAEKIKELQRAMLLAVELLRAAL